MAIIGTCPVFWLKINCKRFSDLFALGKAKPSPVVELVTGHCPIGIYAVGLRILPDACANFY